MRRGERGRGRGRGGGEGGEDEDEDEDEGRRWKPVPASDPVVGVIEWIVAAP